MTSTIKVSLTRKLILSLACAACALGCATAVAAGAEVVVVYQKESLSAYEQQLAKGEIASATFNKKIRSLHLTLKNGQHVLTIYPPHEQPKYEAALQAKNIPVTVLKPAAADKEAAKPVHHKLRYIAGGVLVLVVIVVGGVLFMDRRRKLATV
jgi:hypothetical protein